MRLNLELKKHLVQLFNESQLNYLPEIFEKAKIFSNPLLGVARGDDSIFQKFKKVVGPKHYTPNDIWELKHKKGFPSDQLRVLSIVFPFSDKIREESLKPIKLKGLLMPSEYYSIARNYANEFIAETMKNIVFFFNKRGYDGIAGVLTEYFTIITDGGLYFNWSERHIAFAAGLGTFSLHEGLITEVGCNIRLGSIITDYPLEVTPRKNNEPYTNCLFFLSGNCRQCMDKCPANAVSEQGHDKRLCNEYRMRVSDIMRPNLQKLLKPHYRSINYKIRKTYPVGCAFCQFGVPCIDKNPSS